MISLLLASWLTTQHWEWNKITDPPVAEYRIYWGTRTDVPEWCAPRMTVFPAATSCGILAHCTNQLSCCGEIPMPTRPMIFLVVTAVGVDGFVAGTEHGAVCP